MITNSRNLMFVACLILVLSSCQGQAKPATATIFTAPKVTATPAIIPTATAGVRISKPGEYKGYSDPLYQEYVKTSQYIPVRDGTKLAANFYRPAKDGKPVDTPHPVIWMLSPYYRDILGDGSVSLPDLVKHGYVLVSVEDRGTNASFGTYPGILTEQEAQDAYDVTEWLAAQPWSDGNIGMSGVHYFASNEFLTARTKPPHLKAISATLTHLFDIYNFFYPGGILYDGYLATWSDDWITGGMLKGTPVDEDKDGSMLAAALKQHETEPKPKDVLAAMPYRDSKDEQSGQQIYLTNSQMNHLNEIQDSGVPIYHWIGWYDSAPKDILVAYNNMDSPQKVIMGPWGAWDSNLSEEEFPTELLRWFDYWLKGIDNGIMEEAPIHYLTMGGEDTKDLHEAKQWPLPNEQPTKYYLDKGPSGSIKSANDGALSLNPPDNATVADEYTVDYSTSSGEWTRMTDYTTSVSTNQQKNDEKGLTYTTPPLASDVEVTGHPVIHLWVTSSAKDGDFFVLLEDVDGQFSRYVTNGQLRASHRALVDAPYDTQGVPYHRSYAADVIDLPKEPVELVFDLQPTSYIIGAGHRIRVTITGANQNNSLTPKIDPPPTISVYRDADHPSHIVLPVIPQE